MFEDLIFIKKIGNFFLNDIIRRWVIWKCLFSQLRKGSLNKICFKANFQGLDNSRLAGKAFISFCFLFNFLIK